MYSEETQLELIIKGGLYCEEISCNYFGITFTYMYYSDACICG